MILFHLSYLSMPQSIDVRISYRTQEEDPSSSNLHVVKCIIGSSYAKEEEEVQGPVIEQC